MNRKSWLSQNFASRIVGYVSLVGRQLSVILLFVGIESRPRGWGLTDATQTGNFPICKLTLGRKRNHSVMVERGGRKRDG